eukprot:XP_014781933.1 PREDICTED: uncharacterized protein LOC106877520 [Octopus bimaculoides]
MPDPQIYEEFLPLHSWLKKRTDIFREFRASLQQTHLDPSKLYGWRFFYAWTETRSSRIPCQMFLTNYTDSYLQYPPNTTTAVAATAVAATAVTATAVAATAVARQLLLSPPLNSTDLLYDH